MQAGDEDSRLSLRESSEGNHSRLSLRESYKKATNTDATFAERKATVILTFAERKATIFKQYLVWAYCNCTSADNGRI